MSRSLLALLLFACAPEPPSAVDAGAGTATEQAAEATATATPGSGTLGDDLGAPPEVRREALFVRSLMMLMPSDAEMRSGLVPLATEERRWIQAALHDDLAWVAAMDPDTRRAAAESGQIAERLMRPIAAMRRAQYVRVVVDEGTVGGGVPGTATRLLEHATLSTLGQGIKVDQEIERTRQRLHDLALYEDPAHLDQLALDLEELAGEVVALQMDLVSRLPPALRFLDHDAATELLLGPVVSDWLLLRASQEDVDSVLGSDAPAAP